MACSQSSARTAQKEEGTMAGQILIALRDQDRLGEIIPYVKEIVQPGMRVVFLVRYLMDSWMWLRDHWIDAESPRKALLAVRGISENYSWERQKALAEKRILPACGALQGKGVNVSVDLYTGGFRGGGRRYGRHGEIQVSHTQGKNPFSGGLF